MSHSTPIDKIMFWRAGNWVKCKQTSNLFLRVYCDQLLITAGTKILESLNMNGKIKGICKEDILILLICNSHEVRKLKFQIKSNVAQCLETLGLRFPIVQHNESHTKNVMSLRYRNIDEVLKCAIETMETQAVIESVKVIIVQACDKRTDRQWAQDYTGKMWVFPKIEYLCLPLGDKRRDGVKGLMILSELRFHTRSPWDTVITTTLPFMSSSSHYNSSNVPPAYTEFVKLCLLDPAFPELVKETQKILDTEVMKK